MFKKLLVKANSKLTPIEKNSFSEIKKLDGLFTPKTKLKIGGQQMATEQGMVGL